MPRFGKLTKQIHKVDWSKFKDIMERSCIEMAMPEIRSKEDLDLASQRISDQILKSLELSTETKTITFDPHGFMVLPRYIVNIINEKKEVRRELHRTRDPRTKARLNRLGNLVKFEIRQFKQRKWERFCTELNTHQVSDSILWRKLRAIESAGTPKPPKNPSLKVDSRTVDVPSEVANIFASNLETVFSDPNDPQFNAQFQLEIDNAAPNLFQSNPERIYQISVHEVTETIKQLRSRGAPGGDSITNICLKNLPPTAITQLATIFNSSLELSHMPSSWKNAIVVMIPKPLKNHLDPSNYRPISLLTTLSKLLERLIMSRLQFWIGSNSLLSTYQCGFRKFRQTEGSHLTASTKWSHSLQSRRAGWCHLHRHRKSL